MEKETSNILPINKELNAVKYEPENIKKLIYTIREKQVILDSDVAMLYQYPTKRINETVNRNKARFPGNFCFQLTESEAQAIHREVEVEEVCIKIMAR